MSASLQPISGPPAEVLELLRSWVRTGKEPVVIATSGSTGEPKSVVLSRQAVLVSAQATHERLGGPGQWLLDLPVSGVAGFQVFVRSLLAGFDPVIVADHPDLDQALAAMSGPRRYASLVPTQLQRLADEGRLRILADLDALLVGGAAIDPELVATAQAAGVTVVRTYGMSETCGGCVYDGVPLSGVEVRIDDSGGVWLRGPMLFDCYFGAPEATAEVMVDGWFHTADLGTLKDGILKITGRADEVIISGGVNIPLPAVTSALRRIPGVRDAVAIGTPDATWGSRVVACVVPDEAVCLDGLRVDELRDALEEGGLLRVWAPHQVVLMDSIPLLSGGKIDRLALQRAARPR